MSRLFRTRFGGRLLPLFGILLCCAVGCQKPTIPELAPPKVTTTQPVVATVSKQSEFTGNIRAANDVMLRARVTGFLEEVNFTGGQMVTKDQELFVIEREPFIYRKDQANALLEKAGAELKLAESNYRRAIEAHKGGGVTDEELAERQAQYYQAKAVQLDAEQSLKLAEQDLSYTIVKAPFDGQIGRRQIDAGNVVVDTGGGTELAQLTSTDPIYVYFDVPENLVNMIRRKFGTRQPQKDEAKIAVKLDGEDEFTHHGWINFVSPTIKSGTGTAEIRAVLPNPKATLQAGQFAVIQVYGDPIPDVMLVREEAVSSDLRGHFMLTVNSDGVVQKKPVELGGLYMNNEMRHVMPKASALVEADVKPFSAKDWYIVRGLAKAWPGTKVDVTQDAALGKPTTSTEQKPTETAPPAEPSDASAEAPADNS